MKALDKAKRKCTSSSSAPKKRGQLIDAILHQSPLQSKVESEDDGSKDSNHPAAEAPPFVAPSKAAPLKAVPPCLDLEFSIALESDDKEGDEEVNIVVDSPRRSPAPREVYASGKDAKKLLGTTLRPALGRKRVLAKSQAAHRTAAASSSAMLTPKLLPRSSERSPRPCVLAA